MTHERIHELLCLRLYDECSPEEAQLLETHLAGCADCRAFARELEGTLASHVDVAPAAPAPDLPPTWRRDLAASVERETARARGARVLTFAMGLAAGMLLLLVTRGPSEPPRLHEPRTADLAPPFVPRAEPPAPTTSRGTLALAGEWLRH